MVGKESFCKLICISHVFTRVIVLLKVFTGKHLTIIFGRWFALHVCLPQMSELSFSIQGIVVNLFCVQGSWMKVFRKAFYILLFLPQSFNRHQVFKMDCVIP